MEIQYKPSKPKKEKPAKAPKAPKAEKPMSFGGAKAVKIDKPKKLKEPKVKTPKPEKAKAMTFGKSTKVQTDKPMKMDKAQKPGILSKVDPKLIIGGVLVLIAVVATIMLTVVIPSVEEHGQQINKIVVSVHPTKTVYYTGEDADYTGLRIEVIQNNGETYAIRAGVCQITGFNSAKAAEKQEITVSYQGHSTSFYIQILEKPKPTPILSSITIETLPVKTEYHLGERLNTYGGIILCQYQDGTTKRINLVNSDVYGYSAISEPGTYELTVRYSENGRVAETTYTITVVE